MSPDPGYLFPAIVWSVVGFLSGFTFAHVNMRTGGVFEITRSRVMAVILVILGFVTVGQSYYFSARQRSIVNCQDKVNSELRTVGREERKDYFNSWRAILNAKSTVERTKLFQDHLDRGDARERQRDEAEKTRKKCS